MHIRTFRGSTILEVMERVREALGPDAIILETRQPKGKQVEVRAAVEALPGPRAQDAGQGRAIALQADLERRLREDLLGVMRTETLRTRSARLRGHAAETSTNAKKTAAVPIPPDEFGPALAAAGEDGWRRTGTMGIVRRRIKRPGQIEPAQPANAKAAGGAALPAGEQDKIAAALDFHAVPKLLRDELLRSARVLDTEDALGALACALDARFAFDPVPALPQRPVMLIGAPGVGKTVTAAKLAARAVLVGRGIDIITTDTLRAGAREQMESFTGILKEKLICAASPEDLEAHLEANKSHVPRRPCIIDTPGTNPFSKDELSDLRKFVRALDIEPVLIIAAGTEPQELVDTVQIFATLGVQRMIMTRIDAARRLGSLLAAADGTKTNLAQFSMTPYIARGLSTLNPMSLARLFLEGPQAKRRQEDTPLLKDGTTQ